MKRRRTDKPVHYAHYEPSTGKVEGLYNSLRHSEIPEPVIEITEDLRNAVVRTPFAFQVDLEHKQLTRVPVEVSEERPTPVNPLDAGVFHNDVYFVADKEAQLYLMECLSVASFEPKTVFKALAYKDGKPLSVDVKKDDLLTVMKKIIDNKASQFKVTGEKND